MLVKHKGLSKRYIKGGANWLTPIWETTKKLFRRYGPKVFDFGKKKALEFGKKQVEKLGKKGAEKAADIAKKKISKLLEKTSGVKASETLQPLVQTVEAERTSPGLIPLIKPTPIPEKTVETAPASSLPTGLSRGLSRGLGIKII